MPKQALVIGLGQFGMSLARALTDRGFEVMAVDKRQARVQAASAFAAEAVAFDATDEVALAQTAPGRRDISICAIGDESREGAIVCTALLRQLGAKRVISRATDDVLERILGLVGAHEVVNPERAFGERLATRLAFAGVVDELPLGEDLVITEIHPPGALVGRNLVELSLPKRFGVTVVAVRRVDNGQGQVVMPTPHDPIRADDILVLVAPPGQVAKMMERL
jgi:trk system potassium uptake protein TrkA